MTIILLLLTLVGTQKSYSSESYNNQLILDEKITGKEKKQNQSHIHKIKDDSLDMDERLSQKVRYDNHPDNSFFFYPFKKEFVLGGGAFTPFNNPKSHFIFSLGYRQQLEKYKIFASINGIDSGHGLSQVLISKDILKNYMYKAYWTAGVSLYLEGKNKLSNFISFDNYLLTAGLGLQSHFLFEWFSLALEVHPMVGSQYKFLNIQLYFQRGF